jgi:hypothetical protein
MPSADFQISLFGCHYFSVLMYACSQVSFMVCLVCMTCSRKEHGLTEVPFSDGSGASSG